MPWTDEAANWLITHTGVPDANSGSGGATFGERRMYGGRMRLEAPFATVRLRQRVTKGAG